MSHLKERKEKNCLNCNAEVLGRYCHICGQENVEVKESFWQLATHLIYDIMHFDSKFFDTLKYLLLRPGFLSKEYLRGRRASYLHPIRMYVFTSAIFFIIFLTYVITDKLNTDTNTNEEAKDGKKSIQEQILVLEDSLKKTTDVKKRKEIEDDISGLKVAYSYIPKVEFESKKDSAGQKYDKNDKVLNFGNMPATIPEYDSLQKTLPESDRDNWFGRLLTERVIGINKKYKGDKERFEEVYMEKFKHLIPQMMVASLPLLALIMQLLYIRRRKQFYYVDHLIVLTHVYIAIFISLLVYYGFDGLIEVTDWSLFGWLKTITGIYIFLYGFLAMYKFYGQGIIKTTFKYFILLFVGSILTSLLLAAGILFSFFQI